MLGPLALSDFLGKSWEILEPVAKSKFWDFCVMRRHRSRVHQSRPEKRRDLCHVTQPRAKVNVSCSRAGLKGGDRGPLKRAAEDSREWVPDSQTRVPDQDARTACQSSCADHKGAAGASGNHERTTTGRATRGGRRGQGRDRAGINRGSEFACEVNMANFTHKL